jgi:N-acetylmuramoyl-L-alanine amidase
MLPSIKVSSGTIPKDIHADYIVDYVKENKPKIQMRTDVLVQEKIALRGRYIEKPKYSQEDLYWMSRIVTAEARNQPYEGKVAVANVVMNRVNINGISVKEAIFSKGQFDPVRNGSIYDEPTEEAIEIAKRVLQGYRILPEDVYYFFNPKTAGDSWIRTRKVYQDIGDHRFCYMERK